MKKIIIVSIAVVAVVAAILIAVIKKPASETPKASLRLNWIASASFTGEVVGQEKFDQDHNLDLSVGFGGPGVNPVQTVQSGQDTFGYLAADELLAANEKGADFVIIAVSLYNSPAGFVSLADRNIKTPKDLEGKKVGMLPFGSTTMIYESMLKKNGVDRSKIEEITISSDLKPFLNGSYDVHPVFVYDETVTLDQAGVKYNVIEPKDFGVSIKGPVYFTKRETLDKNPELVKAFVETLADGWNYAAKNRDEAIGMLKTYAPEIDEARERQVLEKGLPYFSAYKGQLLNSDTESWNATVTELKEAKVLKQDVDLNRVLQLQFIHEYYQ